MFKNFVRSLVTVFALVSAAPAFAAGDALPSNAAPSVLYDGGANGYFVARTPVVYKSLSAVVITSETTIWTPAAGKKFRLMGFCLSQGVATGAVTLKDNTAGTTIFTIPQNTVGVQNCFSLPGNGIVSATANNVLTATGVSTETLTGTVYGTEE